MAGGVNSATESAEPANVASYPDGSGGELWSDVGDDRGAVHLYAYWEGTQGLTYTPASLGSPPNFERGYSVSGASLSGDVVIPEYHFGLRVGIIASGTSTQGAFGASITSISIPETVTQIGPYAFLGCSSLEGTRGPDGTMAPLAIPSKVKRINTETFQGCSALNGVLNLSNVGEISEKAFYGCSKLDGAILTTGSLTLGKNAFQNCSELGGIVLPAGMTEIPMGAFATCVSLTHIEIPSTVHTIRQQAFSGCIGLESVNLSASLITIETAAFRGCTSLAGSLDTNGSKISLALPTGLTTITDNVFENCDLEGYLDLSHVTSIGYKAFQNSSKITSLTLSSSLSTIGGYAFSGCEGLVHISIPSSVTRIGDYAFNGCTSLQGTLDSSMVNRGLVLISVTAIGNSAFNGCTALTSVFIPSSVTTIGAYAFANCTAGTPLNAEPISKPSGWNGTWFGNCAPRYGETPPTL
jgi:hypothetical protein